jgi:hypothetical protein
MEAIASHCAFDQEISCWQRRLCLATCFLSETRAQDVEARTRLRLMSDCPKLNTGETCLSYYSELEICCWQSHLLP